MKKVNAKNRRKQDKKHIEYLPNFQVYSFALQNHKKTKIERMCYRTNGQTEGQRDLYSRAAWENIK